MSVSLSLIKLSVSWIRAVRSPAGCRNVAGQIFRAVLVTGLAQVLLGVLLPTNNNGEYLRFALVTSFAELVHLVEMCGAA